MIKKPLFLKKQSLSYATWKFETTSITVKKAVCFHAVIKVIWEDFFEISTNKA